MFTQIGEKSLCEGGKLTGIRVVRDLCAEKEKAGVSIPARFFIVRDLHRRRSENPESHGSDLHI